MEKQAEVDRLVKALVEKIRENRLLVERSLQHGRLKWQRTKRGELQIDLELNI